MIKLPTIPRITADNLVRVAGAIKEILEVGENRRPVGSLDRYVKVRSLTEDAEVVAILAALATTVIGNPSIHKYRCSGTLTINDGEQFLIADAYEISGTLELACGILSVV